MIWIPYSPYKNIYIQLPDKTFLAKDSKEFLLDMLENSGIIYGVFDTNKLIAFGALYFPKEKNDNLGRDIDLSKEELNHVAHLETQDVHPDYRGNGLQTFFNKLMLTEAKKRSCYHILATVSPLNTVSHKNLESLGMKKVKTAIKYGGLERDILYMKL